MMEHMLTSLILLPLLAAVLVIAAGRSDKGGADAARWLALIASMVIFLLSLGLLIGFNQESADFQFVENIPWFRGYNISYHVGVDGISLWMILLTTFLMPICVLCSWKSITTRVGEFLGLFLILEALVVGTFAALDLLLFYLFFEAVLIPMYLIIGIWGGQNRIYAAYKFFLYTLAGSVLFLLALLYLYFTFGTTDIPTLIAQAPSLGSEVQKWLWLALFASFAVKVPMWPVHTWLPDAHVQAPTAGSVILAGILLKLGAYGFLRFSLPMLPEASHYFAHFVFALSIVAVVYTSLVALVQEDMKKLIAYSSVAHMGFVTLGIFSFNQQAVEGAVIQMVSHGVVSGALFLCVGVVYDQLHTRDIAKYGGVTTIMPYFAAFFMLFSMASAGLPGTSGFVGEILVIVGSWQALPLATMGAATGLILGAAYMLWLYRRVMFGEITNPQVRTMQDISAREWLYFVPLAVGVLWLGIHPLSMTATISPSVKHLLLQVDAPQTHVTMEQSTPIAATPSPDAALKSSEKADVKRLDQALKKARKAERATVHTAQNKLTAEEKADDNLPPAELPLVKKSAHTLKKPAAAPEEKED